MKNPKISVIMPVYNSGKYLSTAVDSVLNQSFKEIELILVDDGSTDGSSKKCDEYARKDSRVVVIHQKNGGICNARNAALKVAKGEYIGFCDHDDEFLPGVWERCVQIIKENNYPDLIKFGKKYVFIDENNNIYRNIYMTLQDKSYDRKDIIQNYLELRKNNLFRFVWDGLYKRAFIEKYNILFDPYFKYGGEDHDFCNMYSRYINSIVTLKEVFYVHYLRKNFSTSSKKIDNANTLYYKIESERLYQTLQFINYNLIKNRAIYWNQFFETCILPVISYHFKNGASKETIEIAVNQFDDSIMQQNDKNISFIDLIMQSKKIGLFTYCYLNKYFNFLYLLVYIRYKLIKS